MPASHNLFAPAEGDTLLRSRSGLAHSDREIELMREWIEEGDQSLLQVVAALGECLKAAAAAMQPVRPFASPGMRGPFPEDSLSRHARSLAAVAEAAEQVARAAKFDKAPFFSRHFIPSGGMPSELRPGQFDKHRNDETVYDKQREQVLKTAAIRKQKQEDQEKREAEELDSHRQSEKKRQFDQRLIAEFLAEQPAKAKRAFQSRLRDPAFEVSTVTVIEVISACIAAAAVLNAEKSTFYEQRLVTAVGTDPDLQAICRFYFDNAEGPVGHIVESEELPTVNVKKALAALRKHKERFEKAVSAPVPATAKAPQKKRA